MNLLCVCSFLLCIWFSNPVHVFLYLHEAVYICNCVHVRAGVHVRMHECICVCLHGHRKVYRSGLRKFLIFKHSHQSVI